MRNTFASTMLEVGQVDPKLVVIVGDISHFALQPFAKACPGRFYNAGILEPTIVSMAAGLAHSGLYPVAHTITPFLIERSLEQIKLDFCYQNLGGTLVSVGAAFDYSGLGCSHHCYDDIGVVKAVPNTEVVYPAMPNEFKILFKETYRNGKLTYFRLPQDKHGVQIADSQIRFGKGVLLKPGRDITIVAAGPRLKTAMESLSLLGDRKIDAEVLYFPTIKPFDRDLFLASANKTKRVLVMEEHSAIGGLGDECLRAAAENGGVRFSFINIPDEFQRGYGEYHDHLNKLGFNPEGVLQKTQTLMNGR